MIADRPKVRGKRLKDIEWGWEAGRPTRQEVEKRSVGCVLRGAGNGEAHSARGIAYGPGVGAMHHVLLAMYYVQSTMSYQL